MHSHLQTLTKTVYIEWKIQIRQRTTWMLAGLFFLVGWYSVDHSLLPFLSAVSIAISTAQGLGLFGSLFVIILGTPAFLREFQPTCGFLWTRAFSTYFHMVGKYFGVCAGIGTVLLPVGLWVAYLEGTLHGFQGIVVQAKVWTVILVPTLVSILTMTLLIGLVLRRALWTSLAMVLITGGTLALNLDVTHLSGFAPYGIYVSPLVGYGPDSCLVWLHRAFYLGLAALTLLLGLLVARFVAPRLEKKLNHTHKVGWGLLAIGMLAVIFYTAVSFQHESDVLSKDSASSPGARGTQDCTIIYSYRVELVLHHKTARLDGKAHIQLQPTTTSLQIPIDLNAGLQISQARAAPQGIEIKVSESTLVLDLPQELGEQNVSLDLDYFGPLHYPRRLYGFADRSPEQALETFWPGGYLDRKTAFLTRDGNWHPFPGCAPDRLIVELVGAPSYIAHTANKVESSPERVTLIWEQQPPLPLLAASQNYQTIQMGEATLLVAPHHIPESKLDVVFSSYPVLMSQIETYLQEGKPSDSPAPQIALVPLIRYSNYDPSSKVVLLPENPAYTHLLLGNAPSSSQEPLYSPKLLYHRWVAEQMIRTWWCSDAICPMLQTRGYSIGYMMGSDTREHNQVVLNALLTYAALRLAEPLVGHEFVAAEIASRQSALEDKVLWTEMSLPLYHSPDINRLVVQLHRLWEQTGPTTFWQLVREYHQQYGNSSLLQKQFAQFVTQVTGAKLP